MSLEQFQLAFARLVSDPNLVGSVRRGEPGPQFSRQMDQLDEIERRRITAMADDPRMDVLCALYRSNRLTALVRTVPALVDALGDRLSDTVTTFWREIPRHDLQFKSEGTAFCSFVADTSNDVELQRAAFEAQAELDARYAA